MCKFFVFVSVFVLFSFFSRSAFAQCGESYGKTATFYEYDNSIAFSIASKAVFCQDGVRYAEAKAIEIVRMSPGPNAIRLKETHYNKDGMVMYEGYLEIRFGFGSVVKEEVIRGAKKYAFFTSWPSN